MRICERFDDCVVVETSKQFQVWFHNERELTIMVGADIDYDPRPVWSLLGIEQQDLNTIPDGVQSFGFDKAIFKRFYDGVIRPVLAGELERVDIQAARECFREYFRGGTREYDCVLYILDRGHLRVLHLFKQWEEEVFEWFISFCKMTQRKRGPFIALIPIRWGHEALNAVFELVGKAGKGWDLVAEVIAKYRERLDKEVEDGMDALIKTTSAVYGDEKQVLTHVGRLQMLKQLCGFKVKEVVHVISEGGEAQSEAVACFQEGYRCLQSGNPFAASAPLERALKLAEGNEALTANVESALGLCCKQLGELDKAEQHYLSAIEFLSHSADLSNPLAEMMQNLSNLYIEKRAFSKVEEWGLKAKRAFQQLGRWDKAAEIDIGNLSVVYYKRGDLKAAFLTADEAFEVLKSRPAHPLLGIWRHNRKMFAQELLSLFVAQPSDEEQAKLIKRCQEVLSEP